MSFETMASSFVDYRHAAHAMIYAADNRVLFNQYTVIADIMV